MKYWVGLPLAVLGPSFLDKGVGTGSIVTHLGPVCAQTTPRLPDFDHMPMTGRATIGKLWQIDIIKTTQEILGKIKGSDKKHPVHKK